MSGFDKVDDEFPRIVSRFAVIEDASALKFYPPEDLKEGAACEACGAPASLTKHVTVRKSRVIESMEMVDRVASEYRTFTIPFCSDCLRRKAFKMEGGLSCLYGVVFLLALCAGVLFFFDRGLEAFDSGNFGGRGHEIKGAFWMIMGFFVWPGALCLTAYLLSLRNEKRIYRRFSESISYKSYISDYVAKLHKRGWNLVFSDDDAEIEDTKQVFDKMRYETVIHGEEPVKGKLMSSRVYEDFFRLTEPGIYLLSKGEGILADGNQFGIPVYDPGTFEQGTQSPAGCSTSKCEHCGANAETSHEIPVYREVFTGDESKITGYARECGILNIPLCTKCNNKSRAAEGWESTGFSWKKFVIGMIPGMLCVYIFVRILANYIGAGIINTGSLFIDGLITVVAGLGIMVVCLTVGLLLGFLLISIVEYSMRKLQGGKPVVAPDVVAGLLECGWEICIPPYHRIADLSPGFEKWFDKHVQ